MVHFNCRWLAFGLVISLCLFSTSNAAIQRTSDDDDRYYSKLHHIDHDTPPETPSEGASTKWEWILKSLRPSSVVLSNKAETFRFLDSVDAIYRYVFAGERTRISKRDPAMAAQVESLLREVGAFDADSESIPTVPKKRDVDENEQSSAGGVCGGVGYLSSEYGPMSKCPGRNCKITQVTCADGKIYNGTNVPSNINGCSIDKVRCQSQNVDEETDFIGKGCHLQKWSCPYAGNNFDAKKCFVQLQCPGSLFYGFEAWDYFCENENLVCNGVVVPNPNGTATSPSCSVQRVPCEDISDFSTCRKITQECTTDPLEGLCPRTQDKTVSCSTARPTCDLERIVCLGVEYKASDYTGPLAFCENVKSITCRHPGGDVQTHQVSYEPGAEPSGTQFCRVVELDCAGVTTPFVNSIPTGCSVKRVVCADVANITRGCITWSFGCGAATSSAPASPGFGTSCKYQQSNYMCHSNCTQPGWRDVCKCPIDYTGRNCTIQRQLVCESHLLFPPPSCDDISPLDGEPTCFRTLLGNNYELEILVDECHFPGIDLNNDTLGNFTYELTGERFAFTKTPKWILLLKFINFNSFSDFNGSLSVPFEPHNMLGHLSASIKFEVGKIPRRFMPGGRMYGELRIYYGKDAQANFSPVLLRHIVTVADWEDAAPRRSDFPVAALVLGLLAGLLLVGLVVGGWLWYRRSREKMLKKLR